MAQYELIGGGLAQLAAVSSKKLRASWTPADVQRVFAEIYAPNIRFVVLGNPTPDR